MSLHNQPKDIEGHQTHLERSHCYNLVSTSLRNVFKIIAQRYYLRFYEVMQDTGREIRAIYAKVLINIALEG